MDQEKIKDLILTFTSIFYEALPFIILGSLIAGILEHAIPQRWVTRLIPRNRVAAIAVGCLLGIVFPMCECGIVPIMRRLLRKNVPLSCCVAYMMAGPIINPVVILSTGVAFWGFYMGWVVVALRIGLAFLVAFTTALVIDRQHQRFGNDLLTPQARPNQHQGDDDSAPQATTLLGKLGLIAETAMHDFVDITVFLTLGALLSAGSRMFLTAQRIEELGNGAPPLAILTMIGLAIVLCLCSEADAFVAASFSTLPAAPKLAFLVLGPMLDIKLFILFTRVFRMRAIWTMVACIVIQVFVYSLLTHYLLPAGPPGIGMPKQ